MLHFLALLYICNYMHVCVHECVLSSISPIRRCCPVKSAIFVSFLMMHATDTLSIQRQTHTNRNVHSIHMHIPIHMQLFCKVQFIAYNPAPICVLLLSHALAFTFTLPHTLADRLNSCANACGRLKCFWSANLKRVAHFPLPLAHLAHQFVYLCSHLCIHLSSLLDLQQLLQSSWQKIFLIIN